MKPVLFVIFIGVFLGCSTSKPEAIKDNLTFKQTFTTNEIQDLERLFDFFNQSICDDSIMANSNVCYQAFFQRMATTEGTSMSELNIPYSLQKQVYSEFGDSTFDQIWTIGWAVPHKSEDTLKSIMFKHDGKYVKFLKKVGETDSSINYYYQYFMEAGDLGPSMVEGVRVNHHYFDVEDIRVRFIIALHYLTLNDQWARNEPFE